jgi:catechol 2,3-dioxygenase-like lactoylglutathione lyase family enzyme
MPIEITHGPARIPAQDLERARRWYADKLGLNPVEGHDSEGDLIGMGEIIK